MTTNRQGPPPPPRLIISHFEVFPSVKLRKSSTVDTRGADTVDGEPLFLSLLKRHGFEENIINRPKGVIS